MGLHDGHRKRLKQQFLAHGEDLHDHQLLELLLFFSIPQGDVNRLAHTLLDKFGSIAGVMDALPESLQQTPGVGEHTAVLLKLIPKLAGRYQAERTSVSNILMTTKEIRNFLLPYFRQGPRNEMAYLVCMDAKYKVLGCHKLGEGTVNATDISLRKVVELALAQNASAAILAHNHVSGLALASEADMVTTKRLWLLLQDVGVELVDHVIFVDDDMTSFKDSGYIAGYAKEEGFV